MFCMLKKKKYLLPMFPNLSQNREKQVILLLIPNEEGQHYLAVDNISALLTGIISKRKGNFYRLNCLHLFGEKKT